MDAYLKEMKAEIIANNEKFAVIQSTLISPMDAHDAKTEANHEELMAEMKVSRKRIEALTEVSQEATEIYPENMKANSGL
jgi:hypothetical protein